LIDNHYVHDFIRPFIGSHGGHEKYWELSGNIFDGLLETIGHFHEKDKKQNIRTMARRWTIAGLLELA